MGRSPCCDETGLKKGPWTPEEDDKLINYIHKHGHGSWRALPKLAGLNRCGKSCRLRWTNYLRPDIKRGKFSQEEEQSILNLHAVLGNKWSAIATQLPGRTDNEIKNFWNTHLKKKLIQMGFDPMTHQPRTDIFSTLPHLIALANLKHLLQNPNHYLNHILQLPPLQSGAALPAMPELTSLSLLNSLKDSSSISSHLETQTPPPVPSYIHDSVQFSRLPDLQVEMRRGCDQYGACLTQGNNSPDGSSSPWLAAAQLTETSITNTGDACSSFSSYEGAQMWSELLDDPIFREIA